MAVDKIRWASLHTKVDNPILPIEPKDRWYLLNFVLNAVAELFTAGLVRYDAGQPLKPVPYLIFLTCEVVGEDRIRKVRAMMIRKDQLLDFPYWDSIPKLEQQWHEDRIVTLRRAAELYKKEPTTSCRWRFTSDPRVPFSSTVGVRWAGVLASRPPRFPWPPVVGADTCLSSGARRKSEPSPCVGAFRSVPWQSARPSPPAPSVND